ncbi:hypothetical protein B0A49_09350 [Cryomyces minteri]|uniref:Uncharacterized protein n=1 Tax=Cryomyces minteri TaxID=331657 RepID=A0A4U0WGW2_9PEZI|nr:hypothetical protein B0A49_09350 [Cryomyces minteri]
MAEAPGTENSAWTKSYLAKKRIGKERATPDSTSHEGAPLSPQKVDVATTGTQSWNELTDVYAIHYLWKAAIHVGEVGRVHKKTANKLRDMTYCLFGGPEVVHTVLNKNRYHERAMALKADDRGHTKVWTAVNILLDMVSKRLSDAGRDVDARTVLRVAKTDCQMPTKMDRAAHFSLNQAFQRMHSMSPTAAEKLSRLAYELFHDTPSETRPNAETFERYYVWVDYLTENEVVDHKQKEQACWYWLVLTRKRLASLGREGDVQLLDSFLATIDPGFERTCTMAGIVAMLMDPKHYQDSLQMVCQLEQNGIASPYDLGQRIYFWLFLALNWEES